MSFSFFADLSCQQCVETVSPPTCLALLYHNRRCRASAAVVHAYPGFSDFGDNLSRIFTRPLKTLGEKYFRAVQKPDETFRTSRPGLRPKHENRRREGCFAAETTQAWRGSTGEWTLSRRHAVFPSPSRPSPRLARVVSPFGPSPRRRTRNAPRHERSRKHASFRRQRHEAKSIRSGFVGKDEL